MRHREHLEVPVMEHQGGRLNLREDRTDIDLQHRPRVGLHHPRVAMARWSLADQRQNHSSSARLGAKIPVYASVPHSSSVRATIASAASGGSPMG
jgi:hypothetical protein